MEDDYLLDEEEDLDNQGFIGPDEDGDPDNDESDPELDDEGIVEDENLDPSQYKGKMTKDELWLSTAYDDIIAAGKKDAENAI